MIIVKALAIYLIVWWITLFMVLPWRVRTAEEAGEQTQEGHAPSAPLQSMMGRKLIVTTLVSAAIFGVLWYLFEVQGVSVLDIPFIPRFGEGRL